MINFFVVVFGGFFLVLLLDLLLDLLFIVDERFFVLVLVLFELLWLDVDLFNGNDGYFLLRLVLIVVLFVNCFFFGVLDDLVSFLVVVLRGFLCCVVEFKLEFISRVVLFLVKINFLDF